MGNNYYRDYDKKNQATSNASTAAAMNHPAPHINFAPEYQVAGYPAVYEIPASSNPVRIQFPYVTQWIMITNACTHSQDVFISFTPSGAASKPKQTAATDFSLASISSNFTDGDPGIHTPTRLTTMTSRMNIKNGAYTHAIPIKCSEIYIDNNNRAGCTLMVGLTNIHRNAMPVLSGSDVG